MGTSPNINSTLLSTEQTITEDTFQSWERPGTQSHSLPLWYYGIITFYSLPCVLGMPANLLAIITFITTPLLRKSKPVNYLILNLAFSDFITSALAQMITVLNNTLAGRAFTAKYKYVCLTYIAAFQTTSQASLFGILMLSGERLLAVLNPFLHMRLVTRKSVKITIMFCWYYLISMMVVIYFWNTWIEGGRCYGAVIMTLQYQIYLHQLPIYICLGFTFVFNVIIAAMVLWRQKSMRRGPSLQPQTSDKAQVSKMKEKKAEHRVIMMLLMVVGVFYVCWAPSKILSSVVRHVYKRRVPENIQDVMRVLRGLQLTNLVADPIIYISQNTQFRQAFIAMFHKQNNASAMPKNASRATDITRT